MHHRAGDSGLYEQVDYRRHLGSLAFTRIVDELDLLSDAGRYGAEHALHKSKVGSVGIFCEIIYVCVHYPAVHRRDLREVLRVKPRLSSLGHAPDKHIAAHKIHQLLVDCIRDAGDYILH